MGAFFVHDEEYQVYCLRANLSTKTALLHFHDRRRTPAVSAPATHHAFTELAADDERSLLQRGKHGDARRLGPQVVGNTLVRGLMNFSQDRRGLVELACLILGRSQDTHRGHYRSGDCGA